MSSLSKRGQKSQNRRGERIFDAVADFAIFRERISNFSLKYWAIRPSEVFGARRKAALRGEAYAWTPILGVFDKLRDVGVSPYLGFTLYLSVLQCFGWIEALNDHLIGPKTWDRKCENFVEPQMDSPCSPQTVCAVYVGNYVFNGALVCIGPVMAAKFGFTK